MAQLKPSTAATRRSPGKSSSDQAPAKPNIWNREIELSPAFGGKEKHRFFQMLGVLLDAGLGISEALEVIEGQQKKRLHKAIVGKIIASLNEGLSLSEALARQPKYFNTFERYSIQMGEHSGQMNLVLQDLSSFHEKRQKLKRKMTQAFSYPLVVILIAGGVVFFMVNFVVPMFRDIFARFDAELPAITQAVLSLSDFTTQYGLYIFLAMGALLLGFFRARNRTWFRRASSLLMLRIPLIGPIIRKVQVSRYCYSLALMLRSKVNLDQALQLLEKVVTFEPLQRSIGPMRREVEEGKTFHEAMEKHKIYPLMMQQMVRVGERTARLDDMLEQVAKTYEEESETGINTLTSLLEPLLIVVLGVVVGLILVSMYLPMFELSNTFGGA